MSCELCVMDCRRLTTAIFKELITLSCSPDCHLLSCLVTQHKPMTLRDCASCLFGLLLIFKLNYCDIFARKFTFYMT